MFEKEGKLLGCFFRLEVEQCNFFFFLFEALEEIEEYIYM